MLGHAGAANQAHLRSHSGHGSSFALSGTPTNPEFKVETHHFRTLVLERMRLPLHVTEAKMRVRGRFGQLGASPCCVSQVRKTAHQSFGDLKRHWPGFAGRREPLRDMDIAVSAQDERAIEVSRIGAPTAPRSAACGSTSLSGAP